MEKRRGDGAIGEEANTAPTTPSKTFSDRLPRVDVSCVGPCTASPLRSASPADSCRFVTILGVGGRLCVAQILHAATTANNRDPSLDC